MPAAVPGAKRRHRITMTLCLRGIVAAVTLVAAAGCGTILTPLPPGSPIHIEPDQGILVVETLSNAEIEALLLAGPGKSPATHSLENLPSGRQTHLVALPEGDYRWVRIELPGLIFRGRSYPVRWNLDDAEEWRVSVRAGQVNYPGLLVLRRSQWSYLSFRVLNRSGELLGSIEELFPGLLSQYSVRYAGPGRDDFLGFYYADLQSTRSEKAPLEEGSRVAPDDF